MTDSQLFNFAGGAGPLPLVPQNGKNATCLTIINNLLDVTNCDVAKVSGLEASSRLLHDLYYLT